MSADFTPVLNEKNELGAFRFWCQKVLPLTYDDSLSYYELLCKVVKILNDTIENQNKEGEDIRNLYNAYISLQNYTNEYFDSLDIQKEINNKLDNMANSGELYEIIRRYTNPIVNEQDEKIDVLKARMDTFASLPEGATSGNAELLDIRIGYNGTIYPSAGDAVREQVNELNENLSDISETTDNLFDKRKIVIGIQAEGQQSPARNRALSGAMRIDGVGVVEAFNLPSNIKYEIEYYSGESASTLTTNSGGWNTTAGIVRASKNYPYIRILFGTVDDSDFTESDFDSLRMQVTAGSAIEGYEDHITARDVIARKTGKSLEYNHNVNLFDVESVVIGINAIGQIAAAPRALSGAMKIDGTAFIKAFNLPSNLKYEIEYYSGLDVSTLLGSYGGWITDTNEHVYAQDGTYIRLLFASIDGNPITWTDINNIDILVMKDTKINMEYFKVCTWNVGLWYNGNPHGMDMDLLYEWYRVIGNVDADLFMTQEAPSTLSDNSTLTVADLMGFKYDYINLPIDSDGIYIAKEICSKQPFYNVTKTYFSVGSRLYWKAYVYINGKKVCIINTHLNFDDTYRADEITELLDIMDDEEYVIVCGDFNTKTTEEYNAFTNAGYKIANCGIFGNFITCPNDANNKMLDNCIVSPNISIQSVKTVDGTGVNHISDHVALVVELGIK